VGNAIVTAIEKAGVVGAGGGGFPTHVKAAATADVVVANGAECEPLLRADSELMRTAPERIARGLSLVLESTGASKAVVAVKAKNDAAVRALAGTLSRTPEVELALLENVYPAGDEFLLVFDVTGRVVPEGGIPLDVGVVVNNVTTLAQIADAVEGQPVTRRMVTVQGAVRNPGTFVTPIGTPVRDLVARAGGADVDEPRVIIGGPMMGTLAPDLDEPTTKTVAGIVVLPAEHRLVAVRTARQSSILRLARAACCQCMACTELCPRALLGHALAPHRTVRAIQYSTYADDHAHITSAYLCCECGMCELFACPLGIQPRRILADLKAELQRKGVPNPHTKGELSPDDVRPYRQIPTSRLVARLGLSEYDTAAALDPRPLEPERVVLKLKQHVGEPATPVVQPGETVLVGDIVAETPEGKLGARVHASVSGVVESVTGESVAIRAH